MTVNPEPPERPGDTAAGYSDHDSYPATRLFGIGPKARLEAMHTADEMRARGVAAAPMFKPSMGGWIVRVYPGGIRRRADRRR